MKQNILHISLHYGVERRLQESLASAYWHRLIWFFQSINRLIFDLIIFIIFDLMIDTQPYYVILRFRKSTHQIQGLESRQMTIYGLKVSFVQNHVIKEITFSVWSNMNYSVRYIRFDLENWFAKYFNWIDLSEGWITAESNLHVYRVQGTGLAEITNFTEEDIFSSLLS